MRIINLLQDYANRNNIFLKVNEYEYKRETKFLFFTRVSQEHYYKLTTSKEI